MVSLLKNILLLLLCVCSLVILTRVAIGEPCFIPSNSMEPTIQVGDWLWIDKFTYGGRLPQRASEIPLVNVFTWIKPLREADAESNWGYHRIPRVNKPKHSDIVVFQDTRDHTKLVVKRLVGLPGDTIQIQAGMLLVNVARVSLPVEEELIAGNYGPFVVPSNHYYVLGDNRANSLDSRFIGFIPEENIIGKVNCVLFSLDPAKPFRKKWRWNRFAHLIK